jgi:hypothetical protein
VTKAIERDAILSYRDALMSRSFLLVIGACCAASFLSAAEPIPERQPSSSPPKADEVMNFSLLDYKGKYHELRRTEARAMVLFWTGNGCPIAQQSVTKIRALRSRFGNKGVEIWMINSNPQDDRDSIRTEAQEFSVGSIPILKDDLQLVARHLGVTRTAEAIAINTTNWTVFYRGAIDDQLSEGAKKPKPTEKYLEHALTEFLAGQEISKSKTPVKGCLIQFESEADRSTPVSYTKEIAPLLQKKCVGCHSPGNIGPFALSSYKKVKGWSEMIHEVVLARRMPPWHADPHYGTYANDRSLTPTEARTLVRWIEEGAPRGEGEDPLPRASDSSHTAALGEPDLVIPLPAAQTIPDTGVLQYRYVDAQVEMPQDAWIRAAVVRPNNRKVVHHVIVRVRYPEGTKGKRAEEVFFTSWAPGNTSPENPLDTGKFLPKGAKFNFELHYNTTGKPETDQSDLALYWCKERPKMVLETRATETRELDIAPGEPNAKSFCLYCFKRDTLIFDLVPHMHLRGSWFKYEALFPDGKRETLLSVPNYDFNWQTEYRLAEPKRVPAGTWLLCTGGHDNSTRNPNNPDATKRIKWGLQSFEEMFMGFMSVAEPPEAGAGETAAVGK